MSGYRIMEILGSGSYATVCVAERAHPETPRVVLKVLRSGLARHADILSRTRDEARLLARLDHPNVIKVEALTEIAGRPVVVMEYVDGIDLGTLLRTQREGLPAGVVGSIVVRVASALASAWDTLKVVHRDIKPSNILMATDGQIKLVDFGLAYAEFEDRETHTQARLMGSLGFSAPERGGFGRTRPHEDIYSLGITTVLLLTGRNLLLPRSPVRHDVELERQLGFVNVPGVDPDALRGLIRQMCCFEPEDRISAADVGAEVARCLPPADLVAYAASVIPPLRPAPVVPSHHPDWSTVDFLDPAEKMVLRRRGSGPLARLIRFLAALGSER